jgi:hypothetical protein
MKKYGLPVSRPRRLDSYEPLTGTYKPVRRSETIVEYLSVAEQAQVERWISEAEQANEGPLPAEEEEQVRRWPGRA